MGTRYKKGTLKFQPNDDQKEVQTVVRGIKITTLKLEPNDD
jgi:hypothetical protein